MTLLILSAILCVLAVIARELRLLRRQRENSLASEQEPKAQYKSRIFTFMRSGWTLRLVDLDQWIAMLVVLVIWWKFILPTLPVQPWIKWPTTIIGVLVFMFMAEGLVRTLNPLHKLMHKYDEQVFNRVFSGEELEILRSPHVNSSEREEMYREKGL